MIFEYIENKIVTFVYLYSTQLSYLFLLYYLQSIDNRQYPVIAMILRI